MNPRFQAQVLVREFGQDGQNKLSQTTVGIVGVGALGCIVSEQLCRAGVKKLILIDHDIVTEENLHRQFLFGEKDIGKVKVEIAKKNLQLMNNKVKIETKGVHLSERNCEKNLKDCSIFIDCTDNLETRFIMNAYARAHKVPWIYGGIAGTAGLVFSVIPEGPCFSCIFERVKKTKDCHVEGILNSTVSMIGSMQVVELYKWLKNEQKPILYNINGWNFTIDEFTVTKKQGCKGCSGEKRKWKC